MDLPFITTEELCELPFSRSSINPLHITDYQNSLVPQFPNMDQHLYSHNSFQEMIPAEKPLTPEMNYKKKSPLRCLTARTVSTSPNKIPVIVNRCSLTKVIGNSLLKSPIQSFNSFLKNESTISYIFTPTKSRKPCCNCKKSRCIKLYCDCFAANSLCEGCQCINCHNNEDYQKKVHHNVEESNDQVSIIKQELSHKKVIKNTISRIEVD